MILSYTLGQKHYPIPYNLGKFGIYLISSFFIYFVFSRLNFEWQSTNFVVKNSGVVLFVAVFFLIEKFWKEKAV
jgi:hypothetical protein